MLKGGSCWFYLVPAKPGGKLPFFFVSLGRNPTLKSSLSPHFTNWGRRCVEKKCILINISFYHQPIIIKASTCLALCWILAKCEIDLGLELHTVWMGQTHSQELQCRRISAVDTEPAINLFFLPSFFFFWSMLHDLWDLSSPDPRIGRLKS